MRPWCGLRGACRVPACHRSRGWRRRRAGGHRCCAFRTRLPRRAFARIPHGFCTDCGIGDRRQLLGRRNGDVGMRPCCARNRCGANTTSRCAGAAARQSIRSGGICGALRRRGCKTWSCNRQARFTAGRCDIGRHRNGCSLLRASLCHRRRARCRHGNHGQPRARSGCRYGPPINKGKRRKQGDQGTRQHREPALRRSKRAWQPRPASDASRKACVPHWSWATSRRARGGGRTRRIALFGSTTRAGCRRADGFMARLRRHRIMRSLLRRNNGWLGIQRLKAPGVRHHGKRRAAFDRRRQGYRFGAKLRLLGRVFMPGLMPVLRACALGLAQRLHEQAHNSPAGREGMR